MREALISAALGLALLAGCSGGGGDATQPVVEVPAIPSGKLDPAYGSGSGGVVAVADASGIAVLPDGSAFLSGSEVMKLDPSGSRVSSFTQDPTLPTASEAPLAGESGSVYVIGRNDGHSARGVSQFDAGGRRVATFGENGFVRFDSLGDFAYLTDLVRDAQGNLYVAGNGRTSLAEPYSMAVVKLDRDGHLVAGFGSSGRVSIPAQGRSTFAFALAIDGQGNIYVSGSVVDPSHLMVAKLDSTGRLIGDFGAGGLWFGPECRAVTAAPGLAIDAAGNLLVGGTCGSADATGRAVIFKLDSRGNPVTSFGEAGVKRAVFGETAFSSVAGLVLRPNGEMYVAGSKSGTGCNDFAVTKLNASGNTIASFGDNGVTVLHVANDAALDIALDAAGRVYVGGRASICGFPFTDLGYFVYRLGG